MADSVGLGPANRVFDEAFEASSSTSDTITNDGLQRGAGDGFIYHKVWQRSPGVHLLVHALLSPLSEFLGLIVLSMQVSKLDTLAGLAIRYHVTVSSRATSSSSGG